MWAEAHGLLALYVGDDSAIDFLPIQLRGEGVAIISVE